MKKIIPFKKQLQFKTNVNEITSIALENTLSAKEQSVEGELIINGTYKITETSKEVDEFEFKIPINIEIDNKYVTENIIIDINDFYYETINNNILEVNIEILLDNIIEKPIIEEKIQEEIEPIREQIKYIEEPKEERCIDEEELTEEPKEQKQEQKKIDINNLFDNIEETQENTSTYNVYIVREGDTLDMILTKYNTTKDEISEYNDLTELKIGDKIIIPENNARN